MLQGTLSLRDIGDAAIESRHGYTRVVATVRDQSEFYGLLDRFADLALWPVSLIELGADHLVTRNGRPAHATREAADTIAQGPGPDPAAGRAHPSRVI